MEKQQSPIIRVKDLKKSFNTVQALAGISFEVSRGELFGFLGPNGAGKTTTIHILTGLARPDSGEILINDFDIIAKPRVAQHIIGVVPDESNLYPELSGFENLCFCASLYGLKKNERETRAIQLLKDFGLQGAANRKFAGYSKGMKRKLTIAAGIIHHPEILFLDEPTTGIDVGSARQVRELITGLHRSGTTIFLTTHYIEEAERLCDKIAFIVSGKIVRIESTSELLQPLYEKKNVEIHFSSISRRFLAETAERFPELQFSFKGDDILRVDSDENIAVGAIVHFLEERGVEVWEARKIQPSLEEVFVRITGIEADTMRKEKPGAKK